MALPPCLPAAPRRRLKELGATAFAVGHSYGLLALFLLGSLPYLLTSFLGENLRRHL